MNLRDTVITLAIVTFMSLFSNVQGTILAAIALAGMLLAKYMPGGIPGAAYVVTIGCIVTVPGFPGSEIINGYGKQIGFVALCTPILAYAGISIGKDLDAFAKTGWRICLLSCVVFNGTYIASAIIAQAILTALGQIK